MEEPRGETEASGHNLAPARPQQNQKRTLCKAERVAPTVDRHVVARPCHRLPRSGKDGPEMLRDVGSPHNHVAR